MSPFIDPEYNNLYRHNQGTDSDSKITEIKEFAGRANRVINRA